MILTIDFNSPKQVVVSGEVITWGLKSFQWEIYEYHVVCHLHRIPLLLN